MAKLNKMEREMEEVFERKVSPDFYKGGMIFVWISKDVEQYLLCPQVREKKQKLSDNERDLERRQGDSASKYARLPSLPSHHLHPLHPPHAFPPPQTAAVEEGA